MVNFTDWAEFNSRLLCGVPVSSPRLTPVPVRIPLPAHPRQGSIYEVQSALARSAFNN